MQIEVWSDVVCPWCYIGKRRLESALADFPHRDDVDVVWRSFQLDPSAPTEPTQTVAEYLGHKYGDGAEAGLRMVERVEGIAAEEGMTWRHRESRRVGTIDAYFVRAENVADHDVLRRLAAAVGLDAARVDAVLATDEYRADVMADQAQATAFGASGVPFFVVDRKYGVSGAQPATTFTEVLEQAWADSHPQIEMVTADGDGDGTCGPDGCAI